MTEPSLGEPDAPTRLGGLRVHQLGLLVLGLGLGADALVRTGRLAEAVAAGVATLLAAPLGPDQSLAESAALATAYLLRRRVFGVCVEFGEDVSLHTPAPARTRAYVLEHHGRLDLSGADVQLARQLASVLDALATSPSGRHASVHVRSDGEETETVLCLSAGRPGAPWRRDDARVVSLIGPELAGQLWLLERPGHLRSARGLWRVVRARDLSAARPPLLWGLQRGSSQVIALHVDVLADQSARRRAARGSHESTSNAATASSLGFRQSARSSRRVSRVLGREARVAEGRALLRVGVYVTLWAADRADLDAVTRRLYERAREAGIRLESGRLRQARWFRLALPGGPGW